MHRQNDAPYRDMPSVTNRAFDAGVGDGFGAAGMGGYGDFGSDAATRRQSATRRGRGPRNATRSDALIAEEINERLRDDDVVDATEILLGVEDGRVLLTGEVPERAMKHRAEDIAEAVRGVVEIENRIRVDNGHASFGPGGAVRAGHGQPGSGFSSGTFDPRDARE